MFKKQFNQRSNGFGRGIHLLPFTVCLASFPAWAAPLQNWQYDPAANQLEVTVKDGVKPRYFLMAQPARIILEIPETELGTVPTQKNFEGAVRQIRVSQFQPGVTRIVMELSPDTVLAREQAQLKQVGDAEKSSDRWILRPLLAQASTPKPISSSDPQGVAPSPAATPPAVQTPVVYPPGISPPTPSETDNSASSRPADSSTPPPAQSSQPDANQPIEKPIDIVVSRPVQRVPSPVTSTSLPPVKPPTVVTTSPSPVPPSPDRFPPGIAPVVPQTASISSTPAPQIAASPTVAKPSLQLPAVSSSLSIPDSLPPVSAPSPGTAPSVSVPPIDRRPATPNPLPPAEITNPSATVNVPPVQPAARVENGSGQSNTIEFGQPLPIEAGTVSPPSVNDSRSALRLLLPAGTAFNLRYPGTQALPLQGGQPRQEALVLQTDLRDINGNVIAPEGTTVLGRFETDRNGSRFIAQTISLPGQSVTIAAQSEPLGGNRKVSENRLFRNSGIGALAGAILGGLSGGNVFGGAAAGAALTYVTSPKPATLEPGQLLEMRLIEDLR
ncbi:AMIN domain-containing protein [Phormidesmis priestleyi]